MAGAICMFFHRVVRSLILIAVLTSATSAISQAPQPSPAQGIGDVLDYIGKGWQVLTRSMEACKTVADEKFKVQSIVYVPADIPMPEKAKQIGQRCSLRVEPLPEAIHQLGP